MKIALHLLFALMVGLVSTSAFAAQQPASFSQPAAETSVMMTKKEARQAARDQKAARPAEMGQTQLLAGLMGIFFGGLGVHKFILGYNKAAIIMLVVTLVSIPLLLFVIGFFGIMAMGIIGFIEGIIYLTKTPEDFQATYIDGEKQWF